jgi:D-alanine--poly(phosphoribitol) ligase subunit 2
MQKEKLIAKMIDLLQHGLNEQSEGVVHQASPSSSLIGTEAVVTSMGLVSFITDVESALSQEFRLDVTLVSEQALSRKNSPFRNIDVMADYILELAAAQNQPGMEARHG